MNVQVLIDSVVKQITVLIAQLSTAGGVRAPLAHIANQVFRNLASELEEQGVSRKVSADMFGMALRAYVRKVGRLREGETDGGTTLWQAVLQFIRTEGLVTRLRVTERFARDPETVLHSVLHDLGESGLIFVSGSGEGSLYRPVSDAELSELSRMSSDEGLDEMVWALIHHEGPLSQAQLQTRLTKTSKELAPCLRRLTGDGRVAAHGTTLSSLNLMVSLDATSGWEAAVFDHLQAVVQTIGQRLQAGSDVDRNALGGSTYAFDIWPGHPLEKEVRGQLAQLRESLGTLRLKVSEHNEQNALPQEYERVVTYVGQNCIAREVPYED